MWDFFVLFVLGFLIDFLVYLFLYMILTKEVMADYRNRIKFKLSTVLCFL